MAAVVRAGQTSVSILSYLVHQQSISSGYGGRFSNPPTTPSPVRQTVKKLFFSKILFCRILPETHTSLIKPH